MASVSFAGVEKKKTKKNLELTGVSRVEFAAASAQTPQSSLFETFEANIFPPLNWMNMFPRGGSGGWSRELIGTTPIPGWTGGIITGPPVGANNLAVAFITYDSIYTFNDFWLVTPPISNIQPNDTISFWVRKYSVSYADTLDIYIMKKLQNISDFDSAINIGKIAFKANQDSLGWTRKSFNIGSAFPAGSTALIAFREHVSNNIQDGAVFFIDNVEYSSGIVVPVELTSFTARANEGRVSLKWSTATETNNKGFEVQRRLFNGGFSTIAFVNGKGTTSLKNDYSYTDSYASAGKNYYRLNQIDYDGTNSYSSTVETDVKVSLPSTYSMDQNYPNPFNPTTSIKFSLAADSKVVLKVYNILGQPVSTLINGNLAAGSHSVNFNASRLTSGVYMYKIEAKGIDGSSFVNTKKMILTR